MGLLSGKLKAKEGLAARGRVIQKIVQSKYSLPTGVKARVGKR